MGDKIYSIPFRSRSAKSDFACADGEIAGAVNLCLQNGCLKPYDSSGANRLPLLLDSPFAGGELQRPPRPEVEFSLLRSVVEGWHIHPDTLPSKIADAPTVGKGETPGEKDWGVRAMEVLADFEAAASRQNLFTQPFFVMSAYRVADGTHICPSPPILMIPNSDAPMVEGSADFSVSTMKMSIVAAACRLQLRVKMPELAEKWNGVITHLDIFISKALPLYDPKGQPKGYHRVECKNFTHSMDSLGSACEHRVWPSVIVQGWQPDPVDDAIVAQNIIQTESFFLIGEIDLTQLSTMPDFENVEFNCGGLRILSSLETYIPDFAHLSDVTAEGHTFFSGRITAWNLIRTPAVLLPLALVTPYSNDITTSNDTSDVSDYTPRWVFHPDPGAGRFQYSRGRSAYSLPLRRHPKMWGCFYWGGFGQSASESRQNIDIQDIHPDNKCLHLPGTVWRSTKGSHRLFPDNLQMLLDVGQVIAICRAFRASGLVATTSPTSYAFTTEGVFLLKEMDDGTFRDAGLICGYRLRDASSLELLPTGVRFVTDAGQIVMIEGTKVAVCDDVEAVSGEDDSWKEFLPEEWDPIGEPSPEIGNRGIFVTRPLKLNDGEDRKRLHSLSLRGSRVAESVQVAIYGSLDLTHWRRIALADRSTVSGLWSPYCRFFRIAVNAPLEANMSLEGLVIRLY